MPSGIRKLHFQHLAWISAILHQACLRTNFGRIDNEAEDAGVLDGKDEPDGFLLSIEEAGVIAQFLLGAEARRGAGVGVGLLADGDGILAGGLGQGEG